MNFTFIVNPERKINANYSYFGLSYNDWDDFRNKTSFNLKYYKYSELKLTYEIINIGAVKIMHNSNPETIKIIPSTFQFLSDEFCSLGQDIEYYLKLKEVFGKELEFVLGAINDAAFFDGIKDLFDSSNGFRHSLMRQSSAELALYSAKNILLNVPAINEFKFTYSCKLNNAEGEHKMDFNFGDNKNLPNRMIAIIGKNGTGKTQYLANLAMDLSGISRKKLRKNVFFPKRPLFRKVIAISYSIFDKFSRPKSDRSFSYTYCGLKDSNGRLMSNKKKGLKFSESIEKIKQKNLESQWLYVASIILENGPFKRLTNLFFGADLTNFNFEDLNDELSSGQSFLIYVFTEVIANIKTNSLILFDEPEMHLHPNATANLIRMFDYLLTTFESYALIATHSPIIIQEIPSRYVRVFNREGNTPLIYNLKLESFGENIEVLTQEVFQTKDVDDNYKKVLNRLSQLFEYKEIVGFFDNRLGLSAKTYLLSQYDNPESQFE